jgi:uncharacterized protein (DUF58 family)
MMRMGTAIKKKLSTRFLTWLDKRIPAKRQHTLDLNSIFILPTTFGWAFITMSLSLFLLGTNYQNNIMLLMSYLLVSIMLLALFYTHRNMAQLTLSAAPVPPFHANDAGATAIKIDSHQQPVKHHASGLLHAKWINTTAQHCHNLTTESSRFLLPITLKERGEHRLSRVTFMCEYPLGLYKCWTHLDFDLTALVYPTPTRGMANIVAMAHDDDVKDEASLRKTSQGNSDFHTLADYEQGQPLNRVVWKQVAKSGKWVLKTFDEQDHTQHYLSINNNIETEKALSILTFHVLEMDTRGVPYGIDYKSIHITPACGLQHKTDCLTALARFGETGPKARGSVS